MKQNVPVLTDYSQGPGKAEIKVILRNKRYAVELFEVGFKLRVQTSFVYADYSSVKNPGILQYLVQYSADVDLPVAQIINHQFGQLIFQIREDILPFCEENRFIPGELPGNILSYTGVDVFCRRNNRN